jgi:hypothetical protein
MIVVWKLHGHPYPADEMFNTLFARLVTLDVAD